MDRKLASFDRNWIKLISLFICVHFSVIFLLLTVYILTYILIFFISFLHVSFVKNNIYWKHFFRLCFPFFLSISHYFLCSTKTLLLTGSDQWIQKKKIEREKGKKVEKEKTIDIMSNMKIHLDLIIFHVYEKLLYERILTNNIYVTRIFYNNQLHKQINAYPNNALRKSQKQIDHLNFFWRPLQITTHMIQSKENSEMKKWKKVQTCRNMKEKLN